MKELNNIEKHSIYNHPSSFFHNTDYFNTRLSRIKQKIDQFMIQTTISADLSTQKKQLTGSSQYQNHNENQVTFEKDSDRQNCYSLKTTQKVSPQKITKQQQQNLVSIYNQLWEFNMICEKDQQMANTNTAELRSFKHDINNQSKRLQKIIPFQMLLNLENNKKNGYKKSDLRQKKQQMSNVKVQQQNHDKIIAQTSKKIEQQLSKRRIFKQQQKYYDDQSKKCHLCSLSCQII